MNFKLLAGAASAAAAVDDPLAHLQDAARRANAEAFVSALGHREAREASAFPRLITWAMDVMKDDDALVDMFGISMATLKRWSKGETTPLHLARESVRVRLDTAVRERFGLAPAKPALVGDD